MVFVYWKSPPFASRNKRMIRIDNNLRTDIPRFTTVVDRNPLVDDVMFYLIDPQLWALSPLFQPQKLQVLPCQLNF